MDSERAQDREGMLGSIYNFDFARFSRVLISNLDQEIDQDGSRQFNVRKIQMNLALRSRVRQSFPQRGARKPVDSADNP